MRYGLRPLLPEVSRVFDAGGHIGAHYYGYRRFLTFPENLRWTVCEVPTTNRAGRELAATEGANALSFTEDFATADGADVLLASGVVQYLEKPLVE